MGMDIYGRKPKNKDGEYFRANIWSWRPIHNLLCELCSDILSEKELVDISFNDGKGPKDQETCNEIAKRFNNFLEFNAKGVTVESDVRVDNSGRLLKEEETKYKENFSAYETTDEHLKKWVLFLENCGGFQVF